MKKFSIIAGLIATMGLSTSAYADVFKLDKDTSKTAWIPGGYTVDINIKATNTSTTSIVLDWRVSALNLDAGWTLGSVCEPSGNCYSATTTGLKDGTKTFNSAAMTPGQFGNFKVDYDGDAASNNTKATLVLDVSSGGGAITKAVFVGYKDATGIKTSIIKDNDIAIFPNPANDYVDVVYSPSADVKSIAFYNLIGKLVGVYKVTNNSSARCDFSSDMPSGIYVMRIADSKGNVIATKKITRQ